MGNTIKPHSPSQQGPLRRGGLVLALAATALVLGALPAGAAEHAVDLGTAGSFGVLGGSAVTNTGDTVINGDLGVSPDTAISGFPPGLVNGSTHSADEVADQAQLDTTAAYNDAASRSPATAVDTELGGDTLGPGVYQNTTLGITDELTLDAEGDPNAVFVFQAGSTLITASDSSVTLINGAQACNVFWQVGTSATLGTGTEFIGTVLALTSITANEGATVEGRLLARNGAVTLDNNVITVTPCATPPTTPDTIPAPTAPDASPIIDPPATTGTIPAPTAPEASPIVGPPATTGTVPATDTSADTTDDSSTTSLPATGVGLTTLVLGGALALLLGTAMTYRSTRVR